MYSPLAPNNYAQCAYDRYSRRRRAEEAAVAKRQREREESGNALSDALARLSTATPFAEVSSPSSPALSLTAEELHRLRVKESVARGVQRAVDMESDALVLAHKTRKQEGADTRSKISGLLDRMRQRAANTGPATVNGTEKTHTDGETSAPMPAPAADGDVPRVAAPAPTASAPLSFVRSGLAAGGYVLDTTTAPRAAAPTPLRGKPSSTLLIRFLTVPSPLSAVRQRLGDAATTTELEAALAPLLELVRQTCGRFGVVRSVRVCLTPADDLASKLASFTGTAGERDVCLEREKLRVFVRLDSVAEAFKAAEFIAGVPTHTTEPASSPASWSVVFFPSSLYDEGRLLPTEAEGLC